MDDKKIFSWNNATVYYVMTDRFYNGDPSNDHSYGRGLDREGNIIKETVNVPYSYLGGDLKGVIEKLEEGYFTDLGVNAILISGPFEQTHGFVSGNKTQSEVDNGQGLQTYSYHGYWTLDYTSFDRNMCTEEEFKKLIEVAHSKGIRVLLDIALNHVGYPSLKDIVEYDYGDLYDGWEDYYYGSPNSLTVRPAEVSRWFDLNSPKWATKWWGPDFVRVSDGYAGYEKGFETIFDPTGCLYGLPDLKNESTKEVDLPPILKTKWKKEGRYEKEMKELDDFFKSRNVPRYPRYYFIKWVTDYIRKYGIDGFRADGALNVDLDTWEALNIESDIAFEEYKRNNPEKVLDNNSGFWIIGEIWQHVITKSPYFTKSRFDVVYNFDFKTVSMINVKDKYDSLKSLCEYNDFNVVNYLSTQDDSLYDRNNLIYGGTFLLLAPGAVQIFYGDETARPYAWLDYFPEDSYIDSKWRGPMNWDDLNDPNKRGSYVLAHWRKVGQFRNNHLAVGAGKHFDIADTPYTFGRIYNKDGIIDKVVCVIGAGSEILEIDVSKVFREMSRVRNAYTGEVTRVSNGRVIFNNGENRTILIEKADNSPELSIVERTEKYLSTNWNVREYWSDTLELELYVSNVEKGFYSINDTGNQTFNNRETIVIGKDVPYNTTTKIALYAENSDGEAIETFYYTKLNPADVKVTVNYYNEYLWENPYAYIYRHIDGKIVEVAPWPGIKLENNNNGWYTCTKYGWKDAKVIFSNNGEGQDPTLWKEGYTIKDDMWYFKGDWFKKVDDNNM